MTIAISDLTQARAIQPKTALIVGFSKDEHETAEQVMRQLDGYERFIYARDGRGASRILQGDRVDFVQMNLMVVTPAEEKYLHELLNAKHQFDELKVQLGQSTEPKDKELLEKLNTPEGQTNALYAIIQRIRGEA